MTQKSKCCNAEIKVYNGDEGTNHWTCNGCNKPCDVEETTEPKLFDDYIAAMFEMYSDAGECGIETNAFYKTVGVMLNSHAKLIHSLQNQVKELEGKLNNLTKEG